MPRKLQKEQKEEPIRTNSKIGQDTQVVVSFPDEVKISFVQANEVRYYELFQWLALIFAPIAARFWTAVFTLPASAGVSTAGLVWSALAFTAAALLLVGIAFYHRKKVYHGSIQKALPLGLFDKLQK